MNTPTDPIAASVKSYLLEAFLPGADASELTDDMPLISAGILTSLDTVRLVTFLEDQYHIGIEPHEVNADYLDTIHKIVELVRSKQAS